MVIPHGFDCTSDRQITKTNAIPGQVDLRWEHNISSFCLSTLEVPTGSGKMHFVQACVELLVSCAISPGDDRRILCLNQQTMLSSNQVYSLDTHLLLTFYKESSTVAQYCVAEELKQITTRGNMEGKKQTPHTLTVWLLSMPY